MVCADIGAHVKRLSRAGSATRHSGKLKVLNILSAAPHWKARYPLLWSIVERRYPYCGRRSGSLTGYMQYSNGHSLNLIAYGDGLMSSLKEHLDKNCNSTV